MKKVKMIVLLVGSSTIILLLLFILIITSMYGTLTSSYASNTVEYPEGMNFVGFPLLCDKYIVTTDFIDDDYNNQFGYYHYAVDLVGYIDDDNTDVPVVTLYDGVVYSVCEDTSNAGYGVIMYYEQMNIYVLYCHFAYLPVVEVGQELVAGDILGIQGTTGHSTGIHLHIAFFEGGYGTDYKVDPRDYINLCDKRIWCSPNETIESEDIQSDS